ncbi:MAG: hypothetical protein V1746_04740 [bacterium]
MDTHRSALREMLFNQIWHGLNFISKVAFLALLTPLMLKNWGEEGFGLFSLASSLLVSLALLDCGIRLSTRMHLCETGKSGSEERFRHAWASGVVSFAVVTFAAALIGLLLAAPQLWSKALHLTAGGDSTMAITVLFTGVFMLTTLALEPLPARNQLSKIKQANTIAMWLAIPALAAAVWTGASPNLAIGLYFICLIVPNIIFFFTTGLWHERLLSACKEVSLRDIFKTFRFGGWYYLSTIAGIARGHGITFLVSMVAGPAQAGIFYILLRISEIVSTLGSTASETSMAQLATAPDAQQQAARFRQSYLYSLVFTLNGCFVVGFAIETFLKFWLGSHVNFQDGIGWAAATYGISTALGVVVVTACVGIGRVRFVVICNLVQAAATWLLGWLFFKQFGLVGLFYGAAFAGLADVPAFFVVAKHFQQTCWQTWIAPLKRLAISSFISFVALAAAAWSQQLMWAVVATLVAGVVVLYEWRRMHAPDAPSPLIE